MKLRPRRIALQITPLVDMLLVILFLQYLDSRQQQEATLAAASAIVRSMANSAPIRATASRARGGSEPNTLNQYLRACDQHPASMTPWSRCR